MTRPRFISLVALAFVLYIAASAGAASARLELGQMVALLVALGLSSTPALVPRGEPADAPLRVGELGVALSLSLAAWVARSLFALAGEVFLSLLLPVAGLTLVELALSAPDVPPRLVRQARSVWILRWLAAGAALAGVVSALPPVWLFGRALIAPSVVALAPSGFAASALCLTLTLRLGRRHLASDAHSLSANVWPAVGLCAATLLLILAAVLSRRGLSAGYVDVSVGLAVLALLHGHVWLVSPARALAAGTLGRNWLATGLAVIAAVGAAWTLRGAWPDDNLLRIASLVALVLAFEALRALATRLVFVACAPAGGRLLQAVAEAEAALPTTRSTEDLASRVLAPLRRAALTPEAAPLLYVSHPARELRLDASGQPQARVRQVPAAITAHFARTGLKPLVRRQLASVLVRRPEVGQVLQALDAAGALAVVPLVVDGELEGLLWVAQGTRRAAITLEELHSLDRLGRAMATLIAVFSARERAHTRAHDASEQARQLAGRTAELSEDLAIVRSQFQALAAGQVRMGWGGPCVAYSPVTRALVEHLEQVAPHDLPVALLTEAGMSCVPWARLLHERGGRGAMPFVVLDCGAVGREEGAALLLGHRATSPARPGLLETTGRGTILLCDVIALPLVTQRALAAAVSERRAQPVDSEHSYPLEARLVVTLRTAPVELVAAGALCAELARWLSKASYQVPPLRDRAEDLESLVMLAVGAAARVTGRPVPGLTPEALRALVEYGWPGNLDELDSVVARAVLACRGPRITLADLPPLASAGAVNLGSFVDQERDILKRALARAGGNRTRAARALGLKRTTLIDKLKRHALDDAGADLTH